MKLALSVPVAATTDPVVVVRVGPVIWIARLRTDRVAIFRTSVSKTSNAAVVVAVSVVVTALEEVVAVDLAAVTALEGAVADLAAAVLAGSAAVAGAVDGNNLGLECDFNF